MGEGKERGITQTLKPNVTFIIMQKCQQWVKKDGRYVASDQGDAILLLLHPPSPAPLPAHSARWGGSGRGEGGGRGAAHKQTR